MAYAPTVEQQLGLSGIAGLEDVRAQGIDKANEHFVDSFIQFVDRNSDFWHSKQNSDFGDDEYRDFGGFNYGSEWREFVSKAVMLEGANNSTEMAAQVKSFELIFTTTKPWSYQRIPHASDVTAAQIEVGPALVIDDELMVHQPKPVLRVHLTPPEVSFTDDLLAPMDIVTPGMSSWNKAVGLASKVVAKLS